MRFINRERELSEFLSYIGNNTHILLYGLRGVGKTALLDKLTEILVSRDYSVIRINGYDISSIMDVATIINYRGEINPKLILAELFRRDGDVIIIDEFTAFMRVFVGKTYFPSIEKVAMFIRNAIQRRSKRNGKSIILCSSSIGLVKKLTSKYFAPLFRELKHYFLGPLSYEDAVKLAEIHCKRYSMDVVNLVGGMPFYIIKLCQEVNAGFEPKQALERLLLDPHGDLHIFFHALYEKLSPEERYILHLISRGINRYSKIRERTIRDPYPYINKLLSEGIIKKVRKGVKEAYYYIVDKLFSTWLASREIPSLGKISLDAIIVSSMGFESAVREMLRELPYELEIMDALGRRVVLRPPKQVFRYAKHDREIDAVAVYDNGVVVIEAHFWGPADINKVNQLIRNAEFVEKDLGLEVIDKILVSYFGFKEKTIEKARTENVKLFSAKELKEIQKRAHMYWGF